MSIRPSQSSQPSPPRRRALRAGLATLVLLAAAPVAHAGLPDEGRCPTLPRPRGEGEVDAVAAPLKEGMVFGLQDLFSLHRLLPSEIWKFRDVFFFEGMRMELGPCHRRYPTGAWYREATERYAGRAWVDDDGNLKDYVAGLPFPPEAIDADAADAGVRWAWNFEQRYRGSGPVGSFRLLDLPSRIGKAETYEGTFFFLRTGHRADLPESDYEVPEAKDRAWVGGGRFEEPFNARHLAWRQLRPVKSERRFKEPDDTFVYVPTMRKVRRSATPWVDGFYTPRYSVSGTEGGGGGIPFGSTEFGPAGSIQPTAGLSISTTENANKGFLGLTLRPNAYVWRVVEEREVIAPLNGVRAGYPESKERNYGTSGLSVASDRWDVRWAIVLEGRARKVVGEVGYVTLFLDYQTQQPLYLITRRPNRLLVDVGILVHRFSGDLPRYPLWPEKGLAYVFDPVAASFYYVGEGGSGWRRESYDVQSVPVDADKLRRLTSTDELTRGN